MQTPVLSKKQQKKALSSKKANKETVKNVLAVPFSYYWPLINDQHTRVLTEQLEKYLRKIKYDKVEIPWSELKNLSKEQRKELKRSRVKEALLDKGDNDINRKFSKFGVNEVYKSLESNTLESVLVADDINPQFLIKHVIDIAVLKKTPILVVPNLRNILNEKTGISSTCLGIMKNCKYYKELNNYVRDLYQYYPVPKHHVNFIASNEENLEIETESEESVHKDAFDLNSSNELISSSNNGSSVKEKSLMYNKEEEKEEEPVGGWYLKRKGLRTRAFVPDKKNEITMQNKNRYFVLNDDKEVETIEFCKGDKSDFNDDFISFDMDVSSCGVKDEETAKETNEKVDAKPANEPDAEYRSLVVKRIRNDKNRAKRKADMMMKKQHKKIKKS